MLPIPVGCAMMSYWDQHVEHCGILTKSGEVIQIDNLAEHEGGEFAMAEEDILAKCPIDQIDGVWHTHPSNANYLSIYDEKGLTYAYRSGHVMAGLRYFVVTQNGISEWALDDSGTPRKTSGSGSALAGPVHSPSTGV